MGLKGIGRLPRDTVQARRNATKWGANLALLMGDGLEVNALGLMAIDLSALSGLEFSGGDLQINADQGLEIDGGGVLVINPAIAANSGLEFVPAEDNGVRVAVVDPIDRGVAGLGLSIDTNYFALSGSNLSIVNPIIADIVSSNDITAANFILANGGTVGQAAGPLMTFDDTNNFLGITGCHVGIGEQGAADYTTTNLHISSDWSTQLRLTRYSAAAGANIKMRRARGTLAAPEYVLDGDGASYWDTYAYARNAADTADAFMNIGRFEFLVDGVDAQDRIGGQFQVYVSPGVSAAPVAVMQIGTSGDLLLNAGGDFTTTGLGTFGNLDVDTLNLSGNVISDSTGTISFADEALTTTGVITAQAFNATDENNVLRIDNARVLHTKGTENLCLGFNTTNVLTGNRDTILGNYAGGNLAGGTSDVLIGWAAGYIMTSGSENVCIGRDAGRSITTGGRGIYIGAYAGRDLPTTSLGNICIGYTAGYGAAANVANSNVFVGYEAGYGIRTGFYNVGIGAASLKSITIGQRNIAAGKDAGYGQTTGSDNLYLGTEAGKVAHTYSGTLVLGHYTNATANNQFVVGSATSPISTIYLGEGVLSATPQDLLFSATGGSGTDIAAGDLIIAGGKGTGDADPGDILFQTSTAGAAGATLQTLSTRMAIDGDGNTKIGDGGVTNYAQFKADGEVNLHGTAKVWRHLRVGAANWKGHGVNAPTENTEGVFFTVDFDNTADDSAYFTLIVPYRWDGTTDIEFAVDWFYDGGGSPGTVEDAGTVCWGLEYKSIQAGELVTGVGTVIGKTSAGNHESDKMVRTVFTTKILAANLTVGDIIGLRLFRDVDGGEDDGDTLATDARLLNTHFHFVQNKLGETTV